MLTEDSRPFFLFRTFLKGKRREAKLSTGSAYNGGKKTLVCGFYYVVYIVQILSASFLQQALKGSEASNDKHNSAGIDNAYFFTALYYTHCLKKSVGWAD